MQEVDKTNSLIHGQHSPITIYHCTAQHFTDYKKHAKSQYLFLTVLFRILAVNNFNDICHNPYVYSQLYKLFIIAPFRMQCVFSSICAVFLIRFHVYAGNEVNWSLQKIYEANNIYFCLWWLMHCWYLGLEWAFCFVSWLIMYEVYIIQVICCLI